MYMIKTKMKFIILLSLLSVLTNCSFMRSKSPIDHILSNSGKNKAEIRTAYNYFYDKGDSLQMEALLFLLENMNEHSYSEIALYDSNQVEIEFNILDFEDYSQARSGIDSLSDCYGDLNWGRKNSYNDLENIRAELLIENIELTFAAWQELPWSKNYTFQTLLEYILPYRGSNEPLESWRPYFMELFPNISASMTNVNDPLEASIIINDSLKQMFGFDPRFYLHPTDQGLNEMIHNRLGRCEDMTNFTTYALRSNGIAVTSDYTPYWADSGNNHAWNVVILPNGSSLPFMGCEANPGNYKLNNKMAKAYRKTFSVNPNNLADLIAEKENIPPWLSVRNFIDVTTDYTAVHDVVYDLENTDPDSSSFAYLCVFNSGEWKAIHSGEIKDNKVLFQAMGVDICYLPAFYRNGEIIPLGSPFILTENLKIRNLNGSDLTEPHKLISVTRKLVQNATDTNKISFLKKDAVYEYYYWDDEWILIGEEKATEEPLFFEEVPMNRLYWLIEKESRREERIFTYQNDQQKWW